MWSFTSVLLADEVLSQLYGGGGLDKEEPTEDLVTVGFRAFPQDVKIFHFKGIDLPQTEMVHNLGLFFNSQLLIEEQVADIAKGPLKSIMCLICTYFLDPHSDGSSLLAFCK